MKRIFAIVVALTSILLTSPASAETKRIRLSVESIPEVKPIDVAAKDAVLPDGVREGSAVPKSWSFSHDDFGDEFSHCTDGRRASVADISSGRGSTEKIWEANGKVFLDRAIIKITEGKVHVESASRWPIVYVTENLWAYRREKDVVLVFASDTGVFARAIFYGCSIAETTVASPTGATSFRSSAEDANTTIDSIRQSTEANPGGAKPKRPPHWTGVTFSGFATVSKASADETPMLNIIIRQP